MIRENSCLLQTNVQIVHIFITTNKVLVPVHLKFASIIKHLVKNIFKDPESMCRTGLH
jgi:hypothetical protein